ncbi:osmotic-shock protein [Tardibacter chloracetimidivorans]|uniref:Osmotic-shock protein n=1 Tax=Tardibacter chloracetimidivorans TaxID=1921510 RepID=A0A1L3ZXJ9_9SPHN|nr:YggT family protein [Tardibacter chloracetimidivorans]API60356.1 osmotic-shock protein [Tardibacter chloracetimidivorans]
MNTLYALVGIITMLLQILIWIIVIQAILSWLVAFNVINVHNQFVRTVLHALERITEPLLRPIRRFMPDLGGIDFSPMVLILLLIAVQRLLPAVLFDTGAL